MYNVVTVLCLVAKAQFTAIDSQSDIASRRYKYVAMYLDLTHSLIPRRLQWLSMVIGLGVHYNLLGVVLNTILASRRRSQPL